MKGRHVENTSYSYVVGIDLGTSHSALSYWRKGDAKIKLLEIEQLQAPGQWVKRPLLPSVCYLPHTGEVQPEEISLEGLALPFLAKPQLVLGEWARQRGASVPQRYIASAKSWLCHPYSQRQEAILPWQSSISEKLSPLEATTHYLAYLRACFERHLRQAGESEGMGAISLVLTVPASFDELARNLTYEAAIKAGFIHLTLLEEPQAAFYAWIAGAEQSWRKQVQAGDVVLVCDVGGGTTDFSLIAISEQQGDLELGRISVGDHLLLGGDNMDLALALLVKKKLEAQGHKLDRWQLQSLVNSVRQAKERLLGEEANSEDELPIALAGKGSSLFAQALATTLSRGEVEAAVLEGFFPLTAADAMPQQRLGSGFQEWGLPYETEPAISRHLARFLRRSSENCQSDPRLRELTSQLRVGESAATHPHALLMPSLVLFNGGVFKSSLLRQRVLNLLAHWNGGRSLREIGSQQLDLAVAIGASYFGRSKTTGVGVRISAGTARSYYLGLEAATMAVPGLEPEVKGLCVVPQGTEEGQSLTLPAQQFGLITGQEVRFRFFSSAIRAGDKLGSIVEDAASHLDETASLTLTLPSQEEKSSEIVPVILEGEITEVGTLKLYMKHAYSKQKWDLEFNVRPQF